MKIVRNWIIVSALGLCAAASAETTALAPSGSGTSAAPYQIASLANLRWLSETSSAWASTFVQTKDIDASETNTWNSDSGFSPIGNQTTKFTGSYNGREYVVTGLAINRPSTNYVGLFGHLSGATLDSVGVDNASVKGSTYVGILSGSDSNSTVSYCHASGNDSGNLQVGGLVGLQTGSTITASYANATVLGGTGGGVGGLVGHNDNGSTISRCFSKGKVSVSGNWVGGLVGVNMSASVVSSYSLDTVTAAACVGGLVGYNFGGTIRGSYSAGLITSGGGLVGTNTGAVDSSFWDSTASGQKTSDGGAARSTLLMQTQSTFTDSAWDFASTWTFVSGVNGGYPVLQILDPVVATSIGGIAAHYAYVQASLSNLGSGAFTSHGFCWSTSDSPTVSDNIVDLGAVSKTSGFTSHITGLSETTAYHVRAYVTNGLGTFYGNTVGFSTKSDTAVVATTEAVQLTTSTALVGGAVTWLGSACGTSYGFCWGTTDAPTIADNRVNFGPDSVAVAFTDTIKGLTINTTYYVRAYSSSSFGTSYGKTLSFALVAGSGTEADPYLVANYADLKAVGVGANSLSAVYRVTADIDASPSKTENGGSGFAPIDSFSGTFHGAGHKITGLTINRPSVELVGLFGYIDLLGVVDSLGLEGGSVRGKAQVGFLAGMNRGSIKYSFETGSVSAAASSSYAGGLAGVTYGSYEHRANISHSYASGSVTLDLAGNVGGFVGHGLFTNISDCYATGAIIAKDSLVNAGGFIGSEEGGDTIRRCFATGPIRVIESPNNNVGGFGGLAAGSLIANSYWNTSSTGQASSFGSHLQSSLSVTGLDSAAILRSSNFSSLDYDSTWFQYNGRTTPLLRAFLTPLSVTAKDTTKDSDGVAFSGGAGVSYSTTVASGLLLGTPTYGGTSQGAKDTGHYAITVDSLWSTQLGYLISYKSGTLWIAAAGTDAIQTRPAHLATSHDLAANIARSFGSLAQGVGAAQIGTGIDATDAQTVSVLLPSASSVHVSIFDNLGAPVIAWSRDVSAYDLANLDATGDGRWVLPVSWNGRASNGQAVPAGVYLWKIAVRTEDGQKLETVKKLGLR